jgi:O-antigen ligase
MAVFRSSPVAHLTTWLFGLGTAVFALLASLAVLSRNLLLIGALAAVGLTLVLPIEASFGLFAFLVPFEGILVLGHSGVTALRVIGAFGAAVLLVYGFCSGRLGFPPRQVLWWGLFVGWSTASFLWALDRDVAIDRIATAIGLFGLYAVVASFHMTQQELQRLLWLTVAGGAVVAVVVVREFTTVFGLQGRANLVLGDQTANPNDLAGSLLLPFALALAGALSGRRLVARTGLFAVLALLILAILLTMSRSGMISMTVVLFSYLLRTGRKKLIPVCLIGLAGFIVLMPKLFYQRWEEAPTGRMEGRLDIWIAAREIVKRSPVLGVGTGNFPVAYNYVAGYAPRFRGYDRASHNMYLDVLSETGIIGALLFLAAFASQAVASRQARSCGTEAPFFGIALESALLGLLVQGLSGATEWSKSLWLTMSLLAQLTRDERANVSRACAPYPEVSSPLRNTFEDPG